MTETTEERQANLKDFIAALDAMPKKRLTASVVWEMVRANDEQFSSLTPKQRWQAMRDWAVSQVAP